MNLESPTQPNPTQPNLARKPLWSPRSILLIGILFSFVPAGIMAACNWGRYGQRKEKRGIIVVVLVMFVVFNGLVLYLPALSKFLIAPSVMAVILLSKEQEPIFKDHMEKGGRRASVGLPLLFSILFIMAYVVVLFGFLLALNVGLLMR